MYTLPRIKVLHPALGTNVVVSAPKFIIWDLKRDLGLSMGVLDQA